MPIIDTDDLMSSKDIATVFGVVPAAVSNWVRRDPKFPKPVATVNSGHTPLWNRQDVIAWFLNKNRKLSQLFKELDDIQMNFKEHLETER